MQPPSSPKINLSDTEWSPSNQVPAPCPRSQTPPMVLGSPVLPALLALMVRMEHQAQPDHKDHREPLVRTERLVQPARKGRKETPERTERQVRPDPRDHKDRRERPVLTEHRVRPAPRDPKDRREPPVS